VLRTHRPFAAPGDNSGSDEEGAGADAGRSEKPEAPDSELDGGNGCTIGGGAHGAQAAWRAGLHARRAGAPAEERLVRWLSKYTVDVRALDCALLQPGVRLAGIQRISPQPRDDIRSGRPMHAVSPSIDQWDVQVEIQTVDMARGRVTGLMKAINVPRLPKTVVTYWEGEVIDFVNYMPQTDKWRASCSDDMCHWSLFAAVRAHQEGQISFVNVHASETGLTIEGFYYVCMDRQTGSLEGVYFDPSTQPYQRLALDVECSGRG
ncbi:hypothetical protein H4R21_005451, partial [Coemansia helicoidea]